MAPPRYRTVYLLCHAHTRTGGPEALHQLGGALRDLGHDARMVYIERGVVPTREDDTLRFPAIADPMPAAYAHYAVPSATTLDDVAGNAVVIPEMEPALIGALRQSMPHFWWLSIDNGLPAVETFGGFPALQAARCVHLCQSYYALSYLAERGIGGLPLFDYTAPEHLAAAADASFSGRQDRILFPARGAWFTSWLQRWAPDLAWQEIKGFTPEQVQALFQTSKLYVDFGRHPGKDRMPREAALLGCCVMTGQRGAAGNPFDIPIPAAYKFRDSRLLVPRIVRAIRATLADYDRRIGDFATYRQIIGGEQDEFLAQAARAFGGRLMAAPQPVSGSPPPASAHRAASPA